MLNESFKIALIQMESTQKDINKNIEKACAFIKEASENGAHLICLPEAFNTGFACSKTAEIVLLAHTFDDPDNISLKYMRESARKYKVHIIAPMVIMVKPGIFENMAILIDDNGEIMGTYSKTHPVGQERLFVKKGQRYPVFKTKFGNIGILVCYDISFPETATILSAKGAELIVVVAAWRDAYNFKKWWDVNIACRAMDNAVYVAAVGSVGSDGSVPFVGRSMVLDPTGKLLSSSPNNKEGIVYANLGLKDLKEHRIFNTILLERNSEDFVVLRDLYRFH